MGRQIMPPLFTSDNPIPAPEAATAAVVTAAAAVAAAAVAVATVAAVTKH